MWYRLRCARAVLTTLDGKKPQSHKALGFSTVQSIERHGFSELPSFVVTEQPKNITALSWKNMHVLHTVFAARDPLCTTPHPI